MEAVFMSSSPNKQLKNPNKNITRSYSVSKPSENLVPTTDTFHGSLFFAPPPSLSHSYPLYQNHHHKQLPQLQPPLLPLPVIPQALHASLPSRGRVQSGSPTSRKPNKARDQSLTPKKSSKSKQRNKPKGEEPKKDPKPTITRAMSETVIISSTNPLGPDPNDLPKDVAKVLFTGRAAGNITFKDLETFSGSVFTLSPPPSSLPLPKFSLRPKLGCNAEAAGIDSGATDNLRRLLRLR